MTLDEPGALDAALTDPVCFLAGQPVQIAIDEFQRGGNDLLALKSELDRSDERGQYLLAGSTRFLSTRSPDESLTGRVGLIELLPVSMGERSGVRETFLEAVFAGEVPGVVSSPPGRRELAELIAQGGFPEMVLGDTSSRFRSAWCGSYLRTVTAVANVEQAAEVGRPELIGELLDQLAVRSDGRDRARRSRQGARGEPRPRRELPRGARGPVPGQDPARLDDEQDQRPVSIGHHGDREQREVDKILERGTRVVGIEVKATATPRARDGRHLAYVRDKIGDRFVQGVLLHTGDQRVVLGDRLVAAPVGAVWAS